MQDSSHDSQPMMPNESPDEYVSPGLHALRVLREVLETIDLDKVRSNGYAFQIEMSFRAKRKGFKIVEIPIVFVDRTDGESKMSGKIVREAVWMVWRLRLQSIFGRI